MIYFKKYFSPENLKGFYKPQTITKTLSCNVTDYNGSLSQTEDCAGFGEN